MDNLREDTIMNEEKKQSSFSILWSWAGPYHGSFVLSVCLSALGVAGGMVPYFSAAWLISRLIEQTASMGDCLTWCGISLAGYTVKAICSCLSTGISHTATYHTLRDIRQRLIAKLSKVPMGTILDTPSGQYKTTIVDRVEGMEPTLAHLIPEMTSNLLVPLAIAVYIFVLDWRMGIASLVTMVLGMMIAGQSGKTYAVRWEGAVKVGQIGRAHV